MNTQNYPDWLLKKLKEYGRIPQPDKKTVDYEELLNSLPFIIEIINHDNFKSWIDSKNIIFIWKTILECLKRDKELPIWAKEYLLKTSQKMTTIELRKNEDVAPKVYKALGMSRVGNGTDFSRYNNLKFQSKSFSFVNFYLEAHVGASKAEAFTEVGKILHLGSDMIKIYYYREMNLAIKCDNEYPSPK